MDTLEPSMNMDKLNAFIGRALSDLSAGYGGVMVSLGHRLGLFKAMAGAGPLSSRELAARANCAERYVREWLGSNVAGGYIVYHSVSDTYELPPEHAFVLANEDSPAFVPTAWSVPASMWFDEDKAVEAFRTGKGVPWGDHDGRLHCGVAAFYRNAYRASLVQEWLPMLEGVVDKLKDGATVADVGCGHGHSTTLMARAFPNSKFRGYDTHAESIAEATRLSREAGLSNASFATARADRYPAQAFDLICFFDCLHDMGDPVAAATHAAAALAPDGSVLLVEPFAGDHVGDNISPVGRMYYASSATICCAHSMSDGGHLVLGAQAGEARLFDVFRKAGFTRFRRVVATPFNLILEARL
jgi:SAM-dependent methyltransferase